MVEEIRSLHAENDEFIMLFLATSAPEKKIYLKWDVSDCSEVAHYKIFWDTSLITGTFSLTPQETTTNYFYVAENLTPDTIYYFAFVAVNSPGGETGIAFSSAMPLAAATSVDDEEDDDEHEDEDEEGEYDQLLLLVGLVIILLLLVILMQMMKKGKAGKTGVEEKGEPVEDTGEQSREDIPPK